jgi:hypothetical protein
VLFFDDKIQQLRASLDQCRAELGEAGREIETHRRQLATLQVGHQSYVEAIQHVVDNSSSVFRERLVITVVVGTDDDADRISERHETAPTGRMTQRTFRPILANDAGPHLTSVEEISLRTSLRESSCQVAALPLYRDGVLRVWLIFKPGVSTPTTWQVDYRAKGLWAPLRANGIDTLVWTDRPPVDNGGTSVLSDLVVRFVFPRDVVAPTVSEKFGFGSIGTPTRIDGSDDWLIEFRDPSPAGRRYVWDLTTKRAA